jgi:hypothetical protein
VSEYVRVVAGRQSEPYDTFDYLLEHELGHGLVPTFYFSLAARRPLGVSVAEAVRQVQQRWTYDRCDE